MGGGTFPPSALSRPSHLYPWPSGVALRDEEMQMASGETDKNSFDEVVVFVEALYRALDCKIFSDICTISTEDGILVRSEYISQQIDSIPIGKDISTSSSNW